jgi:hypothetical protein
MITGVIVVLALIAIAMLGCLLVLTWGCLSAVAGFAAARYRALRAGRAMTPAASAPHADGTGC